MVSLLKYFAYIFTCPLSISGNYISNKCTKMLYRDLLLYPKGNSSDGKWLSISLRLADKNNLMVDEKIYVRAHLQILDPHGSNHFTKTSKYS